MRIEFLEPQGELTPSLVMDVLGLVDHQVQEAHAVNWTYLELVMAYDWAMREHLRASDSRISRRECPSFVLSARAPG